MSFPTDLDNFSEVTDNTDDVVAADVNELQTAIESLEAKVGADSSAVATSHDYKIAQLESDVSTNTGDISTLDANKIESVLEDTTPQLGGDLDVNTHKITGATLITGQTEKTAPVSADSALLSDSEASGVIKKATLANILALVGIDGGWIPITGTFTYASSTTITVASGAASRHSVGDKLRFQNNDSGTYLYAYVVSIADTVLTVAGDTVPNATLTDSYYSKIENPQGFPKNFSFTPTITAVTTNPTIGNGTLIGRYTEVCGLVHIYFNFQFGSTSNAGSGQYSILLPVQADTTTNFNQFVDGYIRDDNTNYWYRIGGRIQPSATEFLRLYFMDGSASVVGSSGPFVWGQYDSIVLQGWYKHK